MTDVLAPGLIHAYASHTMAFDPDLEFPERKRLRLADYDYTSAGYYFVTVCTERRACLFGSISDGEVRLSAAGQMVRDVWLKLPKHYGGVNLDVMVVMPNHLHGIVAIGDDMPAGTWRAGTGGPAPAGHLSLPEVFKRFKSLTTLRYGIGVRREGWSRYRGRLWQRSYHERVIRNDRELHAVRAYIVGNPVQWQLDRENPEYLTKPVTLES